MEKTKTVVQQLLDCIPSAEEIKDFISENQADEKMLNEWLWERLYKGRDWEAMEKEQMEKFYDVEYWEREPMDFEKYYKETYGED